MYSGSTYNFLTLQWGKGDIQQKLYLVFWNFIFSWASICTTMIFSLCLVSGSKP